MTKDAESTTQKKKTKKKLTVVRRLGHSLSGAGLLKDLSKAVAGFIESGSPTVCGGLMSSHCGLRSGSHCVFRTRSKHIIAIVNSEHCKWCKGALSGHSQESDVDEVVTRAYLRSMFKLRLSDAAKLSELIAELTRTQTNGHGHGLTFSGTPPFCTVKNVAHISGLVFQKLIEFDTEFVWGDNLIFNTDASRAESGSP
ncbi:hypothetical protein DPEC_G00374600 [Dallia pectoralis]|nr:hypothetical protein DPEC_G00374600 [Dallia pectoralis]